MPDKDDGKSSDPGETPVSAHKARMAPLPEAAPGLEQDGKGNVIPMGQRTQDDQEKARTGDKDA